MMIEYILYIQNFRIVLNEREQGQGGGGAGGAEEGGGGSL